MDETQNLPLLPHSSDRLHGEIPGGTGCRHTDPGIVERLEVTIQ